MVADKVDCQKLFDTLDDDTNQNSQPMKNGGDVFCLNFPDDYQDLLDQGSYDLFDLN